MVGDKLAKIFQIWDTGSKTECRKLLFPRGAAKDQESQRCVKKYDYLILHLNSLKNSSQEWRGKTNLLDVFLKLVAVFDQTLNAIILQ